MIQKFWDRLILNNTVRDWTISLFLILLSILLIRIVQTVIVKRLKAYSAKTSTAVDDFVTKIFNYLL